MDTILSLTIESSVMMPLDGSESSFFRRYWKGYFKLINFRILASSLYQYMTLYMSYWLWMMKNLMSIN